MDSGFDKASLVWEADGAAVSDAAALVCRAPGMGVLASVSCGSEERAEFREAVKSGRPAKPLSGVFLSLCDLSALKAAAQR